MHVGAEVTRTATSDSARLAPAASQPQVGVNLSRSPCGSGWFTPAGRGTGQTLSVGSWAIGSSRPLRRPTRRCWGGCAGSGCWRSVWRAPAPTAPGCSVTCTPPGSWWRSTPGPSDSASAGQVRPDLRLGRRPHRTGRHPLGAAQSRGRDRRGHPDAAGDPPRRSQGPHPGNQQSPRKDEVASTSCAPLSAGRPLRGRPGGEAVRCRAGG
jgi:hypothetical protein